MSEEKKSTEKESSDVDGLFESLIEDFDVTQKSEDKETNPSKASILRDFSKFFNDAAASGSGFQSTIDSISEENIDISSQSETISFSESNGLSEIITEPVTDEDGMIVIFDEEAGINAMASSMNDSADNNVSDSSENDTADGSDEEKIGNDFSADENIEDDNNAEVNDEKSIDEAENSSEKAGHKPFISGYIPWKGDTIPEAIRKIVFLVAIIVFIIAFISFVSTKIQSKESVQEAESIAGKVTTTVATTIDESGSIVTIPPTTEEREEHNKSVMVDFIEISSNVKGFIEMPGCGIYLPVVQGSDNTYYLTHTYDDRKNKAGSIFIDSRCTLTEEYTSPNIVLYGHNQEDGTMFGNLKLYKNNVDFYKKFPTIVFNTEYGIGDYVIFGYFITNVHEYQDAEGEVFHYHDYIETLAVENTFNWYMNEVAQRNQIISPVDVKFGDQLLVLSTCSNEYSDSRFVVLARKLREGEQFSDFDFSSARLNPDARQIDWSLIMSLDGESGSSDTTTVSVSEETETTTALPETTAEETTTETTTESEDSVTTTEDTRQSILDSISYSEAERSAAAAAASSIAASMAAESAAQDTAAATTVPVTNS